MAITVVQAKAITDSLSGSFTNPTTAGNTVVVTVHCTAATNVTMTVTGVTLGGSAGNFAQAVSVQSGFVGSDTEFCAIWADPQCAGGQTAIVVSGTNMGQITGDNGIVLYEIAGLVSSSSLAAVLDVTSPGTGATGSNNGTTGTTVSTGTTAVTTQPSEIAIAALAGFNVLSSPTAGYTVTALNDGSGEFNAAATLVLSSTGTQSFSMTQSSSGPWAGCIATFKAASGSPDMPSIQPGPTWLAQMKPGIPKVRPYLPLRQATENGPLNVTLPTLTTSISSLTYLPSDMPAIQPGPAWLDQFKPGMRKNRPQQPVYPYRTAGESGPLNPVIPTLVTNITSLTYLPSDMPGILPGPTWLDTFKPGMPRSRPLVPPPPPSKLVIAPLALLLPPPKTGLFTQDIRSPENLGAVLTLPSPGGSTTEVTEGATCTLPSYGGTLALVTLSASTVGWTMQTAPLNLLEFNDITIDIAVTQNGSPYNLTTATVNMLFKTAAGTPDGNALIFSSGGGSPAITITSAVGGLAVAQIPNTDLDSEVYFFYRIDVVNGGFTNTCLSGPITWTSL